jgi:hypothetical protein
VNLICVHCGSEIATEGFNAEALANCPQCQRPLNLQESATVPEVADVAKLEDTASDLATANVAIEPVEVVTAATPPASEQWLEAPALESAQGHEGHDPEGFFASGHTILPGQPEAVDAGTGDPASASRLGQSAERDPPTLEASLQLPPRAVPTGMRGGLFIALVFMPLVSYAILATIAVVILYTRPPPPDPLERLPDLEGDFKGTEHQKQSQLSYERVSPESDLPAPLRVPLGKTLRVGDVEVTPLSVELGRIVYRQPGVTTENSDSRALVMHLLYRNVSADCVFSPTDPYFDRRWRPGSAGKPYGFLEIGQKRYFGGALVWQSGRSANRRETIDGQCYRSLHPGEELTSMVCTDPEPVFEEILASYVGPLLWRVQVRRGLVSVAGGEVSATAVIGVLFAPADVRRQDLPLSRRPEAKMEMRDGPIAMPIVHDINGFRSE